MAQHSTAPGTARDCLAGRRNASARSGPTGETMKTLSRWMAAIGGAVLLAGWTGAQADKWVADVGMHEPLCQALVKRLNRYPWTSKEREGGCSWGVITSYPGFKEPPWKKLDPRKHKELMFKLQKYAQDGPDGYFKRLPGLTGQPDSAYRLRARYFIAQGGRLWVWRTRFLGFFDTPAPVTPAPPGKQTVAEVTLPYSKKGAEHNCPGKPGNKGGGGVYLVTPDLSGPDPNVDGGTFSVLRYGILLLYHGKPYFVSGYSSVWRNYPIGIATYCNFRFVKGGK